MQAMISLGRAGCSRFRMRVVRLRATHRRPTSIGEEERDMVPSKHYQCDVRAIDLLCRPLHKRSMGQKES